MIGACGGLWRVGGKEKRPASHRIRGAGCTPLAYVVLVGPGRGWVLDPGRYVVRYGS